MKKLAYLFGPFVGDLAWEFYRFAPYMIYIKKENPEIQMIVFTRQSRFDLYGKHANILIPLRIPNDIELTRDCFRLDTLMSKDYNRIARSCMSQYKKRFEIIKHIYPNISTYRYKIKWQFPRRLMDYNFEPRNKNKLISKRLVKHNNIFIDNNTVNYYKSPEVINSTDLFNKINNQSNDYDSTLLGILIECIKICRVVIGNLDSYIPHLALLLKKPVICINNNLSLDSINLLNPFKIKIIYTNTIEEGIKEYENNI